MVVIRRSTFAMGGGPPPAGEAINGKYGGCLIEHSTFGKVSGRADVIDLEHQYWNVTSTIIRYNYFLGGNDDGIDLDSADGWIYGNLLQDFWPSCDVSLCAIGSYCCGGGNGGGITGGTRGVDAGRTRPVIANNIIRRCYHGVGFKDGAHPLVVNNLILDCFVGITLYSERNDNPGAATTAGNIIWHDGHFGPAARSVVLGSTWWPGYLQVEGPAYGMVSVANSIIRDLQDLNWTRWDEDDIDNADEDADADSDVDIVGDSNEDEAGNEDDGGVSGWPRPPPENRSSFDSNSFSGSSFGSSSWYVNETNEMIVTTSDTSPEPEPEPESSTNVGTDPLMSMCLCPGPDSPTAGMGANLSADLSWAGVDTRALHELLTLDFFGDQRTTATIGPLQATPSGLCGLQAATSAPTLCSGRLGTALSPPPPRVLINELVAKQSSVLSDEVGEHDDFIELANPSETETVSLNGYVLTDMPVSLGLCDAPRHKHSLRGELAPGAFLIIWLDDDLVRHRAPLAAHRQSLISVLRYRAYATGTRREPCALQADQQW